MNWKLQMDVCPPSGGSGREVLLYQVVDSGRLFVARFKYYRPKTNANAFAKFLLSHFTPEEYFLMRSKGFEPLPILKTKGYVSPNERLGKGKSC